jgi:NAD-dependent dihydropyrimidine dehydrogenase PreA subunit
MSITRKEQKPGLFAPVMNRLKCEGGHHHSCKDQGMPCIAACPYGVLEILPLTAADKHLMNFGDRLRGFVHGNRQAYAVEPDKCTACGLCVQACMMHAIKLKRQSAT